MSDITTEADINSGEGWYEWNKMPANTTHIAHVNESGQVYDPEHGWNPPEFLLASAGSRVHKLIRAEEAAAALAAARTENERLGADMPPCDGGCDYNSGPEETCSLHGRPVAEVWQIAQHFAAERDEARVALAEAKAETMSDEREALRDLASAMRLNHRQVMNDPEGTLWSCVCGDWSWESFDVHCLRVELPRAGFHLSNAPDSVLVEGSWIPVKEWPTILGNFMRDNDALGREAKGYAVALAEANRKIDAALAECETNIARDNGLFSYEFGRSVASRAVRLILSTDPNPTEGNTDV